jgi:orotate phosphoribosyltransferase
MDYADIGGLVPEVQVQRLIECITALRSAVIPLYQYIAQNAVERWNKNGNCALVVGATYPGEGAIVRRIVGDMPLLIPGIGAQGGDLEAAVASCMDSRGWGMIINSSRGINFACKDTGQPLAVFAEHARVEAERLTREIDFFRYKHLALSGEKATLANDLFKIGAVKFGSFRLKVHEEHPDAPESPHYFNLRVPENGGSLTDVLVEEIAESLFALVLQRGCEFTHVAGLPKAGDPFARSYQLKTNIPRLQLVKKSEGGRRWIDGFEDENTVPIGGTALVIDDLVTGEDTKLEGVRVLEDAGVHVTDIVVLIDRRPSGQPSPLAEAGVKLHAVYTQAELLNHFLATGKITPEQHARCHLYNTRLAAFLNGTA